MERRKVRSRKKLGLGASHWLVALCAFQAKAYDFGIFVYETSTTGLPAATCIYMYIQYFLCLDL